MNAYIARLRQRFESKMSTYDEMARNRGNILTENCFNNVTANLVGGNFFTGLLLCLDATTVEIGMLNIIVYICNTLQLLSPLLLERFKRRKTLLIVSRAIIHFINVILIGMLAILPADKQTKVILVLGAQALLNIVSAFTAQGFSIWHMKSVPENKRANYFSLNQITSNASIYVFVLLGSYIIDQFKAANNELMGNLLLRGIAIIFAILDIYWLTRIIEYPNEENEQKTDIKLIFTAPFKQKKYLLSVAVVFMWNIFATTTGSYYTVYMLEDVKVSYSFLNIVSATYVPIVFFLGPVWARIINRTSWFSAFYKSLFLYAIFYLGHGFVTADWPWLYPIVVVCCHIMSPGINIVMANMAYYNLPRQNQSVYLTFCTTISMIGALLGNYYATMFRSFAEGLTINIFGVIFTTPQIMVTVTGLLILLLAVIVYFIHLRERKNHQTEEIAEA